MIKKINDEIDFYKKKITSFYYEKNLNSGGLLTGQI